PRGLLFRQQLAGSVDVGLPPLRGPTHKQDEEFISVAGQIESVARPPVDVELAESTADSFDVLLSSSRMIAVATFAAGCASNSSNQTWNGHDPSSRRHSSTSQVAHTLELKDARRTNSNASPIAKPCAIR
ncbi:MAG: hypothetical protein AB7U61_10775, partial [Methylocystis sp.]